MVMGEDTLTVEPLRSGPQVLDWIQSALPPPSAGRGLCSQRLHAEVRDVEIRDPIGPVPVRTPRRLLDCPAPGLHDARRLPAGTGGRAAPLPVAVGRTR